MNFGIIGSLGNLARVSAAPTKAGPARARPFRGPSDGPGLGGAEVERSSKELLELEIEETEMQLEEVREARRQLRGRNCPILIFWPGVLFRVGFEAGIGISMKHNAGS